MDYIYVPRSSYRGADKKRQAKTLEENRVAASIEKYLNQKWDSLEDDYQVIDYYVIARDIGESFEIVRTVATRINGGSNGITLSRKIKK